MPEIALLAMDFAAVCMLDFFHARPIRLATSARQGGEGVLGSLPVDYVVG
jgi:hypothetical protein